MLTDGWLDALMIASHALTSTVTQGLWVLHADTAQYSDTFPQGLQLNRTDPTLFFLEAARFFSPVPEMAYWTTPPKQASDPDASPSAGGVREVLNLALANRDPNAWGSDGHRFRVRSMAEYHTSFVGMADPAVDFTVAGGGMNRACAGKDVSLALGKALFTLWDQGEWEVDGNPSLDQANDFTLVRRARAEVESLWERVRRGIQGWDGRLDLFTRMVIDIRELSMGAPPVTPQDVQDVSWQGEVKVVPVGMMPGVMVAENTQLHPLERLLHLVIVRGGDILPFPDTADSCGEWKEGENKTETVVTSLQGMWSEHRLLVPWGPEKYTDEGFAAFFLQGIMQHRVQRVRGDDPHGQGASYAVYLDFAEQFEVRPGFANYGGTAYFDQAGRVVAIRRNGRTYRPGEKGWRAHQSTSMTETECAAKEGVWKCSVGWDFWNGKKCTCSVPQRSGWDEAKLAIIGTAATVLTAVDHLFVVHLTVGNGVLVATREKLPPSHPLRVLLAPFTFGTDAVNYAAATVLTDEAGSLIRSTGLTVRGVEAVAAHAVREQRGQMWKSVPERFAEQGIDGMAFPLHEDGTDFHRVVKNFLHSYLTLHFDYAGNACGADQGVRDWYERLNMATATRDLPPVADLTCEGLEELLTTAIYHITAMHTHVGSVTAEYSDPCHTPFAWREGETCGTPRTSLTEAFVGATGNIVGPRLVGDYTHLFPTPEGKAIWRAFQEELASFGERVDRRNARRPRQFKSFDIRHLDISVYV
eukprot:Sspe_Gene.29273::Locus_13802_Transcript_2_2_Confidence_0.667_Length_3299::g.29273::m.29273